jgi:hypothetical protein
MLGGGSEATILLCIESRDSEQPEIITAIAIKNFHLKPFRDWKKFRD